MHLSRSEPTDVKTDRKVWQTGEGKAHGPSAFLLCVLVFLIYNANLRLIHTGDSIPARLLPFSLLLHGNLYLDAWVDPYLKSARGIYGIYFAAIRNGHWVSAYSPLQSLVITPLYALPAIWVSHQHPHLASSDVVFVALVDLMEKLSASLIMTVSVGFLYSALRKITRPTVSVLVALIYGLGGDTWTVSSQALWKHGFTELCFTFLLWALLRDPEGELWSLWIGVAVGMAVTNKAPNAIIGLAVFFYLLRYHRDKVRLFCEPIVLLGVLQVFYNVHFFGRVLGTYPNPFHRREYVVHSGIVHSSLWDGIGGLLVSPNRGLLVYSPWVLFAIWGGVILWRKNIFPWVRYLMVGIALYFLGHARYYAWWGGWCYGPRYPTDLLPFLAFFLVPVWPRLQSGRLLRAAFVAALAASLWVQVVGAFYYKFGWDAKPISIDRAPQRVWSWPDTQISRAFRTGLASPDLLYAGYLLFHRVDSPSARPGPDRSFSPRKPTLSRRNKER